jgi:hypothetical protein
MTPNTTLTTEDMCRCGRKCAEETGELWREHLPDVYTIVLEGVKELGGVCCLEKLTERVNGCGRRCKKGEVGVAVKEMEEMGLLRVRERMMRGSPGIEVRLLKF